MAHSTTHAPATGALHFVTQFFTAIGSGLVRLGEANARVRQVEALSALSDAQLAERGLARQDIVPHVFRDSFYV